MSRKLHPRGKGSVMMGLQAAQPEAVIKKLVMRDGGLGQVILSTGHVLMGITEGRAAGIPGLPHDAAPFDDQNGDVLVRCSTCKMEQRFRPRDAIEAGVTMQELARRAIQSHMAIRRGIARIQLTFEYPMNDVVVDMDAATAEKATRPASEVTAPKSVLLDARSNPITR